MIGSVWFVLAVGVWMRHFGSGGLVQWFRYAQLGPDFPTAILNLASNPFMLVSQALVVNFKAYYLIALLASVGFLPLLAWREATLIIVPALMLLLSQDDGLYKLGSHHSAPVLPFLFYSAAYGLQGAYRVKVVPRVWTNGFTRYALAGVVLLLTVNIAQVNGYRVGRIDSSHVEAASAIVEKIPPDAKIRVEGSLIAWLSTRRYVSRVEDRMEDNYRWWVPEFIVLDSTIWASHPVRRQVRQDLVDALTQGGRYEEVAKVDGFLLFRAVATNTQETGHLGTRARDR
jgi:hypothetical protein